MGLPDLIGRKVVVIQANGQSTMGYVIHVDGHNFVLESDGGTKYYFSDLVVTIKERR